MFRPDVRPVAGPILNIDNASYRRGTRRGRGTMFAETVERLDEVFVQVKNLAAMRTFYKDVLGFKEEFYHEDWGLGLQTGGQR